MAIYGYKCDTCEVEFDIRKPMSEATSPESCPECGDPARKLIVPCGVVFSGDGWATKNGRVANQMRERRNEAGRRQEERLRDGEIPGGKLVPNVAGRAVDSWSEAAKLAKSKGKATDGYEKMAAKEKALTKRLNSKTS